MLQIGLPGLIPKSAVGGTYSAQSEEIPQFHRPTEFFFPCNTTGLLLLSFRAFLKLEWEYNSRRPFQYYDDSELFNDFCR